MSGHKLVNHVWLDVKEYDDGQIRVIKQTLDQATRRVVPQELFKAYQSPACTWTIPELLLIGSAELLSRENGLEYPLPF